LGSDQHQDTVGVAVNKAWNWGVGIFREGVSHLGGKGLHLTVIGDDLFTNGIFGVVRVDQGYKIRSDINAKEMGCIEGVFLILGEGEHLADFFGGIQAIRKLPAPAVPLVIGDVFVDGRSLG
jgi:hypothetical protein